MQCGTICGSDSVVDIPQNVTGAYCKMTPTCMSHGEILNPAKSTTNSCKTHDIDTNGHGPSRGKFAHANTSVGLVPALCTTGWGPAYVEASVDMPMVTETSAYKYTVLYLIILSGIKTGMKSMTICCKFHDGHMTGKKPSCDYFAHAETSNVDIDVVRALSPRSSPA